MNSNDSTKNKRRYTPEEKQSVQKRGAQKEAAERFGISTVTISSWMKATKRPSPRSAAASPAPKNTAAPKAQPLAAAEIQNPRTCAAWQSWKEEIADPGSPRQPSPCSSTPCAPKRRNRKGTKNRAPCGLGQTGLGILTRGSAAASRYIEARFTSFAREVVFSPKVTEWQLSYDGSRNKGGQPAPFPLLLAQEREGIAVGLSSKILPHNFNELIEASIAHLRGQPFQLLPDFPTGGVMDATNYRDGERGTGRVRIRARILTESKKLLRITEIPFWSHHGNPD